MTQQSPLASPQAWNMVAESYTTELLPLFALYAQDAISLAELPANARVLDVAAGPGTLSLLAAEAARHVTAIDFSDQMVTVFKRRAAEAAITNVQVQQGDGQALPFDDNSYDAAFSMFGLMFFPDRGAGFRELCRVLKPGCRAVVSSWTPVSEAPLLAALFNCIGSLVPELSFGKSAPPLAGEDEFRSEMLGAGFRSAVIHTVTHQVKVPSVKEFWASQEKASAPIGLLRADMADETWRDLSVQVVEKLEKEFGTGELSFAWPARLGVGVS